MDKRDDSYDHNFHFTPSMPESPPAGGLDYYKVYEAIWRNMERENALISYRASWGLVFTGGIFAAEAVFGNLLIKMPNQATFLLAPMLVLALCAAGVCIMSHFGVKAAREQINSLRHFYYSFGDGRSNYFEQTLQLPRPFGDPLRHRSGHLNAKVLPIGLCAVWTVVAAFLGVGLFSSMVDPTFIDKVLPQENGQAKLISGCLVDVTAGRSPQGQGGPALCLLPQAECAPHPPGRDQAPRPARLPQRPIGQPSRAAAPHAG